MTADPVVPGTSPYRLRTFGTLTLTGPDGAPVLGTHGHHRRRLALLAALASAGEKGWSRDQLLLFFWPDANQARARHSLDQLLYALRSSIGEELFSGSDPVRLNPAVVTSDIGDFTEALERGDPERAVAQYRGSFLDGFYIDGAPEFGRWVEEERARQTASFAGALQRLAQDADARQDHASAVGWWSKLSEVDPVSARSATGLIRSLMNSGDHAAALKYAERYEALVAEELGTSVGPAVAGLVAEVRAAASTEPVVVPRGGPVALAVADPLLPNGKPARRPQPAPPPRPPRFRQLAFGALLVGIIATLVATMIPDRSLPPRGASIAVLPLRNVSRDLQDAPLVDGLTEEITGALQKIGGLRVIARLSAFSFRNAEIPARRIADSLGVTYLLEGSFQRIGTRLRIQVHLIDAPNDSARWTQTYDRELEDIFAIQAEIATSVARELNLQLGTGATQRLRRGLTTSIAAHDLYLRGKDPVNLRTDSAARMGLELLRQAVSLDSNFAAAYANIPYLYFSLSGQTPRVDEVREFKKRADEAARRALALDPDLPEAHIAQAVAHAIGVNDLSASEAALRRALDLGGAPRVHEHLSRVLMWSGRHAEALVEATRAAEDDPLSATAVADLGEALCVNRRFREGQAHLTRVSSVQPPLRRTSGYKVICLAMQGRWKEALAESNGPLGAGDPWSPLRGYLLARSGATAEARQLESDAKEFWQRNQRGAIWVAYVAAGLGDLDTAFVWLDRARNNLETWNVVMYPIFEPLHQDPRFEQFRQRVGLPKR